MLHRRGACVEPTTHGRCRSGVGRVLTAFLLAAIVAVAASASPTRARNGKIAFWSDLGPAAIFVINPDGTGRRRLTDESARAKGAAWSPNGTRLAFYGSADQGGDGNFDIYVMNSDGTKRERLTGGPAREVQPAWSPDGRQIAYGRDDDIWIMSADGSDQHLAIRNAAEPAWSPDGRRLAFGSLRRGRVQVYVRGLSGGVTQQLTKGASDNEAPSWSPDSRRLLFVSFRNGESDIYVMRQDGSRQRRLTRARARDDSASWSPDGRRIVFTSFRNGNGEIYLMNADGSKQRRLTRTQIDEDADGWQTRRR
jgi:Tol biopolymer transport system component